MKESSRHERRLNVNAPVVSLFLSAVFGVLLDAWFSPGLLFWRLCFGSSIIGLVFSFSVRGVHFLFHHNDAVDDESSEHIDFRDIRYDSSKRFSAFVFNIKSKIR